MKKIALTLSIVCLTGILYAQSPLITDSREFGTWIFAHPNESVPGSHFDTTKSTIPPTIFGTSKDYRWTPDAAVRAKAQAIVRALQEAHPKPSYQSHMVGINVDFDAVKANKTPSYYNIHIGDKDFSYDKNGKIKPIVQEYVQMNTYDGLMHLYVNYFPNPSGFDGISRKGVSRAFSYADKLTYKDTQRNRRSTPAVYQVPPQHNFEEEARSWKENPTETMKMQLTKLPKEHFRLQNLRAYLYPREPHKSFYRVSNLIFFTYNNKLPFLPLKKSELLDTLDIIKDEEIAAQKKFTYASSDYEKNKKHYDDLLAENLKKFMKEKEVIQKLRELNKDTLQAPAILHPKHNGVIDGYLGVYGDDRSPRDRESIKDVFETDPNRGTSLVIWNKDYYTGRKPDEIRTLILEWQDDYRPTHNPNHGKPEPKGKPTVYSDAPGNMRHILRHNFDWSKLTRLMAKP